jgi:hypothetical protein
MNRTSQRVLASRLQQGITHNVHIIAWDCELRIRNAGNTTLASRKPAHTPAAASATDRNRRATYAASLASALSRWPAAADLLP